MVNNASRNKILAETKPLRTRERLLSIPRIIVFTLLIGGVMVLLYPRDELVQQVTELHSADALSRAYLDNLLRTEPRNTALRLKRFEADLADGRLAEAERALAELERMNDPQARYAAAHKRIVLRAQQTYALPAGSPARAQARAALHRALDALAEQPLSRDDREWLANQATTHGAYDLATRLYYALSLDTPDETRHWTDLAARTALWQRHYREAATLYFKARQRASDDGTRKYFYRAGVNALLAGNLATEALTAAESQLGDLENDPDTLLQLVRVARAANRNDRAAVYVRKLLHYALLDAPPPGAHVLSVRTLETDDFPARSALRSDALDLTRGLPACPQTHAPGPCWQRLDGILPPRAARGLRKANGTPQLPFNDEIYRLGYDVFLSNRNLRDAYAVAAAAVRQAPGQPAWRERLAKVAEWNGQPAIALEQWRYLALNQNSEAAWQALLRLAPGLFDYPTLILALRHEHQTSQLDDAGLKRLVQAYEANAEADQAIDFLRQSYRQQPRRILLEQVSIVAEHLGRTPEAIAALRQLAERYGIRADEARRLAALQVAQGDLTGAYRTLQQHQGTAQGDRAYQTLLAELAWRNQDKATAKQLYQRLQTSGTLADYEAERLVMLLGESSPQAAAELAFQYWRTQHNERFVLLALSLLTDAGDTRTARRLLDTLAPADLARLELKPAFLARRADVSRKEGRHAAAIADLRRASALDPNDPALRASLLWVLVEARQRDALAAETSQLHPRALMEPALWAPMGAAWASLGRPREALPYYAKQAARQRNNYLWQISYAQVLEDAGQADKAWRLRRHAWLQLRRAGLPAPGATDAWLTQASLALRLAPGDVGARWLREALRQDHAAQQERSPEARELVTAWLLSTEQNESAQLWLAQQYSKQLSAPRWAEAALALQNNDTATLRRIAEGDGDDAQLPAETRAAAALQLEEYAIARKLAFDGLRQSPDHDTLHQQLTESVWQQQNRVSVGLRSETLGALDNRSVRTGVKWDVRPHLKLGLELAEHRLSSNDTAQLLKPPPNDLRRTLSARLDHNARTSTSLSLGVRNALENFASLQLDHQLQLDRRLRVGALIGINTEADETAPLMAGGMKNTLKLNTEWLISAREYLLADMAFNHYYGQDRADLGTGFILSMQAGHHLRIAYPDLTVKLIGGIGRFGATTPSGSITNLLPSGVGVLPDNTTLFGVGVGAGESVFEQYSQAFRPYATLDLLNDRDAGWGYGLELGFVVSPLGNDWLRGRYREGRSRFAGSQDASFVELEYRHLF